MENLDSLTDWTRWALICALCNIFFALLFIYIISKSLKWYSNIPQPIEVKEDLVALLRRDQDLEDNRYKLWIKNFFDSIYDSNSKLFRYILIFRWIFEDILDAICSGQLPKELDFSEMKFVDKVSRKKSDLSGDELAREVIRDTVIKNTVMGFLMGLGGFITLPVFFIEMFFSRQKMIKMSYLIAFTYGFTESNSKKLESYARSSVLIEDTLVGTAGKISAGVVGSTTKV